MKAKNTQKFESAKRRALRNIGEAWKLIEESKLLLKRKRNEARS